MIRLAVELDKFSAPVGAALRRNFTKLFQYGFCDTPPPVFCDENQVVVKCVNAVKKLIDLDIFRHSN